VTEGSPPDRAPATAAGEKASGEGLPSPTTADAHDLGRILDILKALSARRDPADVLFTFTAQIAETLAIDRCSVVRVTNEGAKVRVVASHEDPLVKDLEIDLAKYPELGRALETGRSVIINDVAHHPQTQSCAKELASAGINSLIVVPVILFEGRLGSLLLRAARRGGSFSARDVRFCELIAESAANAVERAYLMEDLKRVNAELEHLARTDELTGLYNQRYFRQRLMEETGRAMRYGTPLACMFMDVDNFKSVNDRFGHIAGDDVLRELGARTLRSTRASDIVARYGGEEIVILLPQTDYDGAVRQAGRLLSTISGAPFPGLPREARITVSIGVSMFDKKTVADAETLLARADAALYEAKARGKNRIVAGEKEYV
jgi:diguanylate cyclase (GGDEF)-like protein